ncbi:MAG: enoyl-CoA hydratase-related protein [Acidimicrobiales bacterium]|jgi:enoyl-CoA hydratase
MATVLTEQIQPGVTLLTLNRPHKLNAMTSELVDELHEALGSIATDRTCRVVVLTGAGRGFCAGLDLGGYGTPPGSEDLRQVEAGFAIQTQIARLVPRFRSLPQPVIAAVNGPAAGGGLALALASDVRIAARSARFNVAFVKLGLSGCDIGVSWLLPRLIGASRAWEMMLTGRIIDADEADRIGLVLKVVADGEVVDAALETASLIAGNSPWGIRMTKEVMWSQLEVSSLQAGIDLENRTQTLSSMTGDMREAVLAFLEKRPADFA